MNIETIAAHKGENRYRKIARMVWTLISIAFLMGISIGVIIAGNFL